MTNENERVIPGERELYCLGYTPASLLNQIENIVNRHYCTFLDGLQARLEKRFHETLSSAQIEAGIMCWTDNYMTPKLQEAMEKFREVVAQEGLLEVPPDLVPAAYANLLDADEDELDAELEEARRKVCSLTACNHKMIQEVEKMKKQRDKLRHYKDEAKRLSDALNTQPTPNFAVVDKLCQQVDELLAMNTEHLFSSLPLPKKGNTSAMTSGLDPELAALMESNLEYMFEQMGLDEWSGKVKELSKIGTVEDMNTLKERIQATKEKRANAAQQ